MLVYFGAFQKKKVRLDKKRTRGFLPSPPPCLGVHSTNIDAHTHIDLDFPASLFQPGFSVSVRNLGKMGFVSHENSRDYPLGNELI